jgi:VanZ family protein
MGWPWVWRWAPALLWILVVSGLSSEAFSAEETGALLLPLLQWLFPGLTGAGLEALHFALRKAGHVTEFAVLALFWYRALAWGRRGWQGRAAAVSALLVAGFAAVDEGHQAFTVTRTASVVDVGWDVLGALLGLGGLWLFFWIRVRKALRRVGWGGARRSP